MWANVEIALLMDTSLHNSRFISDSVSNWMLLLLFLCVVSTVLFQMYHVFNILKSDRGYYKYKNVGIVR